MGPMKRSRTRRAVCYELALLAAGDSSAWSAGAWLAESALHRQDDGAECCAVRPLPSSWLPSAVRQEKMRLFQGERTDSGSSEVTMPARVRVLATSVLRPAVARRRARRRASRACGRAEGPTTCECCALIFRFVYTTHAICFVIDRTESDSPHWIARRSLIGALLARRSSPGALLLARNAQVEADYSGVAVCVIVWQAEQRIARTVLVKCAFAP